MNFLDRLLSTRSFVLSPKVSGSSPGQIKSTSPLFAPWFLDHHCQHVFFFASFNVSQLFDSDTMHKNIRRKILDGALLGSSTVRRPTSPAKCEPFPRVKYNRLPLCTIKTRDDSMFESLIYVLITFSLFDSLPSLLYHRPGQVTTYHVGNFRPRLSFAGFLAKCLRDNGCRYQHHQDLCQDHIPDGHACFCE